MNLIETLCAGNLGLAVSLFIREIFLTLQQPALVVANSKSCGYG